MSNILCSGCNKKMEKLKSKYVGCKWCSHVYKTDSIKCDWEPHNYQHNMQKRIVDWLTERFTDEDNAWEHGGCPGFQLRLSLEEIINEENI